MQPKRGLDTDTEQISTNDDNIHYFCCFDEPTVGTLIAKIVRARQIHSEVAARSKLRLANVHVTSPLSARSINLRYCLCYRFFFFAFGGSVRLSWRRVERRPAAAIEERVVATYDALSCAGSNAAATSNQSTETFRFRKDRDLQAK